MHYCRIYSVRTNGPTLCPWLWLPYIPEPVEKPLREAHGFVLYPPRGSKVRHLYTKQSHVPLLEVFQQIRERMEAIAKGIVSDHWPTVI